MRVSPLDEDADRLGQPCLVPPSSAASSVTLLPLPMTWSTPTCIGWLVASDGGVFSYGDTSFKGSLGNSGLYKPVVGMAAS